MGSKKIQILADLSLVFVTLVWGATFVTVKEAIQHIEPYYFLAIRFGLATLIMLIVTNRRITRLNTSALLKGILVGIILFAAYVFQTFGLQYTTASNAGFITGLSVVFVPFFLTLITKKPPKLIPTLGIISATAGLGLLTINDSMRFNYGDVLVLFCAFSYAIHILLVGKYAPDNDPFILATIQIATVAIASYIFALFNEQAPTINVLLTKEVWQGLLITAIFATALAFFLQTLMQKFTSPTHTAIIFTMEPVFAALFAYLIGGETFTLRQGFGALFILAGMLAAELGGREEIKEEVQKEIVEDTLKV